MLSNISHYKLLLASGSPRRKELLGMLGIPFSRVALQDVEEVYPSDLPAVEVAPFLSRLKSDAYTPALDEMIITADTVVIAPDGMIMGKPTSDADARSMLRRLSGAPHQVVTGVTVATAKRRETIAVTTDVIFSPLSNEEIDYYVANFHPLDKAGAYGIQEWIGAAAVDRIEGSYFNVMGLPVHQLYLLLRDWR